ncbi:MAG: hypothetical protein HC842_07190, partial [Cytophagales bacterium]|nr:hypothetical protein [Cytophagales bacterium]
MEPKTTLAELAKTVPAALPQIDIREKISQRAAQSNTCVVVLDDDPTGTQTVHGVPVLTQWSEEALAVPMKQGVPLFYILTNSRALHVDQACELAHEVGTNLQTLAKKLKLQVQVISRSDSTLRGHFPHEVDALKESLGAQAAITFLVPAFFEGGRFTAHNIHYVREGEELIPAAQTPFAQDKTFGYKNSNLKQYVEEKTQGTIKADEVHSLSLELIRSGREQDLVQAILALPAGATCVVNALAYSDLETFTWALLQSGRSYVARSAASWVPVLGGLEPKPLLQSHDLARPGKPVLVVVGSHVPKSTEQLAYLLETSPELVPLEFEVKRLLDHDFDTVVNEYVERVDAHLAQGKDAVLYTSRQLVHVEDKFKSLELSKNISDALTTVVQRSRVEPGSVIAKGGITSSDVATIGLGIRTAMVEGQ